MELTNRARQGDLEGVKRLVEQHVNVNAKTRNHQTALYCACEHGRTEVAQYLLDNGASVRRGAKPLIAAARYNHNDCVKLLLQYNSDVNCTNTKQETPMSVALQKQNYSIILLLLQHDAIPPAPVSLCGIAVELLKCAQVEHTKVIQKLVDEKIIDLRSENTLLAAFSFAFKRGSVELAERMLSSDSYPNIEQLYPDAAYYSAKNNWPTVLSKLIEKGVDVNVMTDGQTPLYVACKEGHESVVSLLLKSGADPNVPNKVTPSPYGPYRCKDFPLPLQIVVQRTNAAIFNMLLENGAKIDQAGEPLLHIACSKTAALKTACGAGEASSTECTLSMIRQLLQKGVNVNAISEIGDTALYRACVSGHLQVVQVLLEAGADVNLTRKGCYPLIAACKAGNVELINVLVEAGADVKCCNNLNETCLHAFSDSYLHIRVQKPIDSVYKLGIENVIKLLVESGVDVNARCSRGETALYRASTSGLEHIVHLLLEAETAGSTSGPSLNVNAISEMGDTALYRACTRGHLQVVQVLLEAGADVNLTSKEYYPLMAACEACNVELINLLVKAGADVKCCNRNYETCLYAFVDHYRYFSTVIRMQKQVDSVSRSRLGIQNVIKLLVESGVDVNACCRCGETALYRACKSAGLEHNLPSTQWTETAGSTSCPLNVNAISEVGETALCSACESGRLQMVQVLLEAGADVNLASQGRYPLIAACKAADVELINMLVKAGADMNCCSSYNETCLHAFINSYLRITHIEKLKQKPAYRVSELDIENVIKLFLKSGVDVNARCSRSETALYRASIARHEHTVHLLLEAGAETAGSISCRPLYAACERGYTQIVDLLLQHDADPNASTSIFLLLGQLGVRQRLRLISSRSGSHDLPISCAAKKGYTDIVDLLLKHGADVNKHDQSGKSALIHFIEFLASTARKASYVERHFKILKCMLLAGGDINKLSDCDGRNALHVASSLGMCDVMMQLIEHGANCDHLTSNNESALDLACEKGHKAPVEMLLKNGAKPDRETATTYRQSRYDRHNSAMSALCRAAKNGSETMVKMLLQYGADVNASDEKGSAALHLTTLYPIMETLLTAGANVNATNDNGDTALSIVCEKRQIDLTVVKMLLKFGADPNTGFPLHAACNSNDLEAVQLLLVHGADANRVKKSVPRGLWMYCFGMLSSPVHTVYIEPSPMCIACRNGNVTMVGCLLKNGADTTFTDHNGNSVLHLAVQRLGEEENSEEYDPVITLLLQHNSPVNVVSKSGESPLYVACMKGLTGVVRQLVDCRADVGLTTNNSNKYPLLIACQNKFRGIAMMLLERGADANVSKDYQTPLKVAAANGDAALLRQLISRGADLIQMQNISDTALHAAVRQSKTIIVRRLLKAGATANVLNKNGETPLSLACKPSDDAVNIDIVRTLLEHGADPNICPPVPSFLDLSPSSCSQPWSPLSAAVTSGNIELVSLLIKFGAKLDHCDKSGGTALHFAISYDEIRCARHLETSRSDTSTVKILLSSGADVNALNRAGASPLFLACRGGKTDFVKLLLTRDANPNNGAKDKLPIHAACRGHHYDSVKLLLKYKADVTACDENGRTALHYALESEPGLSSDIDKRATLVQLLLEGGASVTATAENGESLIYIACSKGLTSIAKKMLECGAVVDVNSGGKLPLIAACRNKHVPVVQLLLAHGADPNVLEPEGDIPLHVAATNGSSELVELLLKHGANVDIADILGNTALYLAIICYHPKASWQYSSNVKSTVDILMENKADVNAVNGLGETPLYMAVSRELLDVVSKMLQVYGGNPNTGLPNKSPLVVACRNQNVELVDMLLNHGAQPNSHEASPSCSLAPSHELCLPLFVAVDTANTGIITSLLNAGASVNATDHEGRNVVCFAAEKLTSTRGYQSVAKMSKILSAIRFLIQHDASFSTMLPNGDSPLHLVVNYLPTALRCGDRHKACVLELLQLMVEHGAVLVDSSFQVRNISRQSNSVGNLAVLATFDGKHKFIVDLFRAGAGIQLIASCCSAVSTSSGTLKYIALSQAAVLAGYVPSAEELVNLQLAAAKENTADGLLQQLVDWLNEDRQQVPSLIRQCRVAIRHQLSTAAQYRTILPAIDQLPLPNDLKLYLQFDGSSSEVDLNVKEELQLETLETFEAESDNAYDYNSDYDRDYDYDVYDSDNDCYYYGNDSDSDSDHHLWGWW